MATAERQAVVPEDDEPQRDPMTLIAEALEKASTPTPITREPTQRLAFEPRPPAQK